MVLSSGKEGAWVERSNGTLWYIPVEEEGAWYEGISRTTGMIDYSGTSIMRTKICLLLSKYF